MKAGKMHHRLYAVIALDLLGDLDSPVAVGRSARAECDAYEVGLKLAENIQGRIDVFKFLVLFGREYLERQASFMAIDL